MRDVWLKRSRANIIDGHKLFLDDLDRIADPNYLPTQEDILHSRTRTTAITTERYKVDGVEFEVYDVGGQRAFRRKWFDCFHDMTAVIFVAGLSDYDQHMSEAKLTRKNRMEDSLELFQSICTIPAFEDTPVMLFLNKKDIFMEKIMYSDIAAQRPFSDYNGPPKDFNRGISYFMQKFKHCLASTVDQSFKFSEEYMYVTCATDTELTKKILDTVSREILKENMNVSGFGPVN